MSDLIVGVDVGGTKIAAAALAGGVLGEVSTEPTDKSSSEALIEAIAGLAERVAGGSPAAVGIGLPSVVDFESGSARSSVNVPLQDVPVRTLLSERLGVPVVIDNDATVAAFAEAHSEGELMHRNLVMFTVGTGVGGGVVLDGRPYRGATGAAGELGHTLIGMRLKRGAPKPADFPQLGSLESLAAGTALDRLAKEAAADFPDSFLGRRIAAGDRITGHDAVEGAQDGDEIAVELVRMIGERLGIGIANAINAFDPDVVAIGGGAATAAGDLMLEPARHTAEGFVLPGVGTRTEIRLARHGNDSGVLGAALTANHELNERGGSR